MDHLRDYTQDQEMAKQFLKDFTHVNSEGEIEAKYWQIITKLAKRQVLLMVIDLADLDKYNHDLCEQVKRNTMRYHQIFYAALDELMPPIELEEKDIMDVFIEQRLFIAERNRKAQPLGTNPTDPLQSEGVYPPDLIRRAEIAFKPVTLQATPIREVKAESIGKLVTIRGIVTRVADVKPKITIVCYTCDQCGCETFQAVKGNEFTPLFECSSSACKATRTLGRLTMQTRGSKFVKYQEIKLQEHSDQVPIGHIPRAITVMAHGEQTRRCAPGDHISVSGVFLTVDKSSFRMRTGGLSADTYIEVHYITQMTKTEDDELNVDPLSNEEAIELVQSKGNFLRRLSGSIAPEIYGHEDLKIALLLLLVGGVDQSPDGMKIRGNINICLMGDPGVAKSQLLNFIDRLAPRSQFTTGRGSSGVGLTAAVLKDPVTNELALEGGALVLADQGICCIDEFDKMMDADRTAIHEVMEQQTVSIAKAGIMTTLNARVSILAAANPAYGRYNVHKKIEENLQLPPALLSRFDLLWLIQDRPDKANDLELANHITYIHSNPGEQQEVDSNTIDMKVMRRYINLCKTKNPIIPPELDDKLVQIYLTIRSRNRISYGGGPQVDTLFTSPRSLLAIIRMSTAFARLRLSDVVEEADIDEAVRLFDCSRASIEGWKDTTGSTCADVLRYLREFCGGEKSCGYADFLDAAEAQQMRLEEVKLALDRLSDIESIVIKDSNEITILDSF